MAEFDFDAYVSGANPAQAGFDMDAYVASGTPERTMGQEALRKAEFGARGLTDSTLETIGAIPDLVSSGLNMIGLNTPTGGYYTNKLKEGWDAYSGVVNDLAGTREAATPVMSGPMTTGDKIAYGSGRGAADAASVMLPAAALARTAKPLTVTGGVARELSSHPVMQTAAGMVGGATGEATGNPYLGMAASMAVPAAVTAVQAGRQGLQTAAQKRQMVNDAPSRQDLKTASNAAYRAADESGVVVKPESYTRLLDDMAVMVEREGGDEFLEPTVFNVMKALQKGQTKELSIRQLETARKQIGKAVNSMDPNERRIGAMMRDMLDDYIGKIGPDDILAGSADDAAVAAQSLDDARGLWAKNRKVEILEEAIDKASRQASGTENGLRVQFRALANNPRKMRGFSAEEQAAIRDVAEGTPTRNALRFLGKFGITLESSTNALLPLLGGGAGFGVGGPVGAVALPAAGTGARYAARKGTENAANFARALTASGGGMPAPAASIPNYGGPLTAMLLARTKDRIARGR